MNIAVVIYSQLFAQPANSFAAEVYSLLVTPGGREGRSQQSH